MGRIWIVRVGWSLFASFLFPMLLGEDGGGAILDGMLT